MTAARAPLIELREVWKTYRSGALAVEVLRGVSLRIRPGEFVAIMGASGSGKTTLMNLIGCLDRPTGGQYCLGGRDIGALDRDALALLRRDSFGFVFQQYNLLPNATAAENVELPAIYAGLPAVKRRSRALALLGTLGLADRAAHRPRELSGGQQQRVSIARALMNGGRVILADEPTGALDSQSGREVLALLRELNAQGHTIVLITHDPAVAGEAGRRVTIADGVIVADDGAGAVGVEEDGSGAADAHVGVARPVAAAYGFRDAVKMAWRSLRANLFRTILTLLGIIIGVGSVVAMLALGTGAKDAVLSRIEAMGTNLLVVRPGAANLHGAGGTVATLTPADAKAIAALPGVVAAVPEIDGAVTVRYRGADDQTEATATTADYPVARDWPTDRGIFFLDEDVDRYAPVTVLGRTVAEALFADGADPIGAYVLVNNVPLQVIGVMAEKGATSWGRDMDDVIFVPLTTGSLRLLGQRYLRSITVQVADSGQMDAVQAEIEQLLLARHRARDFRIRNMASIIETVEQTQNTLTMLLGSIAAISLLVGGIGVMNIMLVSVTERTREIGIRMATGARAANILLQFVTEAVVVCALGGLVGVLGGLAAAWTFDHFGMPAIVSLPPVLLAFGSAFLTGLLFGYMPARKAARLNPVTALGAE